MYRFSGRAKFIFPALPSRNYFVPQRPKTACTRRDSTGKRNLRQSLSVQDPSARNNCTTYNLQTAYRYRRSQFSPSVPWRHLEIQPITEATSSPSVYHYLSGLSLFLHKYIWLRCADSTVPNSHRHLHFTGHFTVGLLSRFRRNWSDSRPGRCH